MSSMRRVNRFPAVLLVTLAGFLAGGTAAYSQCCLAPDNGGGTAQLPATGLGGCLYLGTSEIVDGLPLGSTLQINASLGMFTNVSEGPGGSLGGTFSTWDGVVTLQMTGTGSLLGFNPTVAIPLTASQGNRMDWAPRTYFAPIQTASADLYLMFGVITTDPDFDFLRITGGTNFGMPSPGVIQLVSSGSDWAVAGFFDVFHRIDFIGRAGSPIAGMSGSTTRTRRWVLCEEPVPVEPTTWGRIKLLLQH